MGGESYLMPNITLPYKYSPRDYQLPLLEAMDAGGYKRAVQVWHRRAGKEKTDFAGIVCKKMMERVGSYYYIFPKLTQGRKILWDGMDKTGFKFLDHFPRSLMKGPPNQTEMKFTATNGSIFQVVGSDHFDSVMGTNPVHITFSEYSLQDPMCWSYFRPILAENDGTAIFNFTPRGENHAFDIYNLAKGNPKKWFCNLLTVDDTQAISRAVLDEEREEIIQLNGNDALYHQEYYCSFSVPISGAYYAAQISKAYRDGRVGSVPHDPRITVDTWWDLGLNDRMSIWFTQQIGAVRHVIDYYENMDTGMPHYVAKLNEKPYIYGKHTAPHDIGVRELMNGQTRRKTADALGITFETAPRMPVIDGIDAVRGIFDLCRFDASKCRDGLNALKSYRKKFDEKRKTYMNTPYHDWSSNGADAFRSMAVAFEDGSTGLTTGTGGYSRRGRRQGLDTGLNLLG